MGYVFLDPLSSVLLFTVLFPFSFTSSEPRTASGWTAASHRVDPPHRASPESGTTGDDLRSDKNYLDAIDYYEAALEKILAMRRFSIRSASGNCRLHRYKEARKSFERSIKADLTMPTPITTWA